MASLEQVREALAGYLEGLWPDVGIYADVPSVVETPGIVLMPVRIDYGTAMGQGVDDDLLLDLYILCSGTATELSQDSLDSYVSGAGSRSLREAVFKSYAPAGGLPVTFGLPRVTARVLSMESYGVRFQAAGLPHLGAVLRLTITTSAYLEP
jgi:hypothetical protein